MATERNPLEMILDEECFDPIILYNEKNEPIKFEQVFIYPDQNEDEDRFYAILRPEDDRKLAEDEALVYELLFDEEKLKNDEIDGTIKEVDDVDIVNKVFDAYEKMYQEELKKTKQKSTRTSSKTTTKTLTKKSTK